MPSNAKDVAKRLNRLERIQAQRKPEMKLRVFAANLVPLATAGIYVMGLSNIPTGDGVADRTGSQIRIHKVEILGNTSDFRVDVYLLNGPGGFAVLPTYLDFQNVVGGQVFAGKSREFKTIKQFLNLQNIANFRMFHRFKYPMIVDYADDTSSGCCNNQLWLVFKNNTPGSVNIDCSARIHYTDV